MSRRGEALPKSVGDLVKEWRETRDDAILDVLKAGDENFINRTFSPCISGPKCEDDAPANVHLHFVVNQVGLEVQRHCLCIAYQEGDPSKKKAKKPAKRKVAKKR